MCEVPFYDVDAREIADRLVASDNEWYFKFMNRVLETVTVLSLVEPSKPLRGEYDES